LDQPAERIRRQSRIYGVRRLWEKPNQFLAQVLQLRGCLWNSFVMVASVRALLGIIESAIPQLYDSFAGLSPFLGTPEEPRLIETLYERMVEVNFSHQVLAHRPERLAVLKVIGVRWNDLGEPKRVMASLDMAGIRPHWADAVVPQFA
jgi:mannose-1-phosphate guanylyltransferase